MSSPFEMIKENPAIAIGGVLFVLVLLSLRGGGGTSPQAMINAQLENNKIASQTNIALSGINANSANVRATATADVYKTGILATTQLAGVRDTNATRNGLAVLDAQTKSQALSVQRELGSQEINARTGVAYRTLDMQSKALQDASNLRHYQIEMNTANLPQILNSQVQIAQANGQTAQAIASINQGPAQTQANTAASNSSNSNALGWVSTIASLFL